MKFDENITEMIKGETEQHCWTKNESTEVIASSSAGCDGLREIVSEDLKTVISIKCPGQSIEVELLRSATVVDISSAFSNRTESAYGDQVRFLYGGRVLKPSETLEDIMRYSSDKSNLTVRVLLPPTSPAAPKSPPKPRR